MIEESDAYKMCCKAPQEDIIIACQMFGWIWQV